MIEIIQERKDHCDVSFRRSYVYRDDTGAGFSFECDEKGNVDADSLNEAARENYQKCIDGTNDVLDKGVLRYENNWTEYPIGKCACGEEIEMYEHGACGIDCEKCGRIYNSSGQELAPRSQWGYETGECLADIERGGDPFDE
jgi:hypothetical protein